MNQIQVPTSTVPSWVHLTTAFMVPLSVHVTLRTHCSLDMSYCIPFRTLSISCWSEHFSDFNTAVDISEPVHFWTHVDRNFFAKLRVGNNQEKFVTQVLGHTVLCYKKTRYAVFAKLIYRTRLCLFRILTFYLIIRIYIVFFLKKYGLLWWIWLQLVIC